MDNLMEDNENLGNLQNNMEDKSIFVKRGAVQNIPGLKSNPITNIIIKKFSKDKKVNITKMKEDLIRFTKAGDLDFKIEFLFKIYDSDGDNFISSLELFDLLKQLNNNTLEDNKIQNIVDQTFAEIGEYTTKMNFEQFKFLLTKDGDNDLSKILR